MKTIARSKTARAIQIWLPELRHRQLKSEAALDGKSLSDFVTYALFIGLTTLKSDKNKHNTAVPTTEQATA
jgi:hypothetical protein